MDQRLIGGVYGIWKPRAKPEVYKLHKHLIGGVYLF